MDNSQKKIVSFYLPVELWKRLKAYSAKTGLSQSALINLALNDLMKKNKAA